MTCLCNPHAEPNAERAPNCPVHGIIATKPVQTVDRKGGKIRESVYMRAYEVYCHSHGSQEAMVTGGCRGGFSTSELIAFLYARSFPKDQWSDREEEAFRGMEHI